MAFKGKMFTENNVFPVLPLTNTMLDNNYEYYNTPNTFLQNIQLIIYCKLAACVP